MPAGTSSRTMAMILARSNTTSVIRISNTLSAIPNWQWIASKIFGDDSGSADRGEPAIAYCCGAVMRAVDPNRTLAGTDDCVTGLIQPECPHLEVQPSARM